MKWWGGKDCTGMVGRSDEGHAFLAKLLRLCSVGLASVSIASGWALTSRPRDATVTDTDI